MRNEDEIRSVPRLRSRAVPLAHVSGTRGHAGSTVLLVASVSLMYGLSSDAQVDDGEVVVPGGHSVKGALCNQHVE